MSNKDFTIKFKPDHRNDCKCPDCYDYAFKADLIHVLTILALGVK